MIGHKTEVKERTKPQKQHNNIDFECSLFFAITLALLPCKSFVGYLVVTA